MNLCCSTLLIIQHSWNLKLNNFRFLLRQWANYIHGIETLLTQVVLCCVSKFIKIFTRNLNWLQRSLILLMEIEVINKIHKWCRCCYGLVNWIYNDAEMNRKEDMKNLFSRVPYFNFGWNFLYLNRFSFFYFWAFFALWDIKLMEQKTVVVQYIQRRPDTIFPSFLKFHFI